MSMEKMFSRFRSLSGSKLNKSPTNPNPPSQLPPQPPSKEDIIDTIDGFGEKIQGKKIQDISEKIQGSSEKIQGISDLKQGTCISEKK